MFSDADGWETVAKRFNDHEFDVLYFHPTPGNPEHEVTTIDRRDRAPHNQCPKGSGSTKDAAYADAWERLASARHSFRR
jgi:hypothetical protein